MKKWFIFLFAVLLSANWACRKDPRKDPTGGNPNPDWTDASHGNSPHDYSVVFPQESVNELEIHLGAENWTSVQANMKALYGSTFGAGAGGLPPGGVSAEPDYFPVTVKFRGKAWNNVGFRLKGNSTLNTAWRAGIYKLPFRLNFDKFAAQFPEITDQHFYGFNGLSFSPGAKDNSLIREKITADIFRKAGVPTPQTAFYKVFIDFGDGLKYCGVYCAVEFPEDNMIKAQFGQESGNIYKPESKLATFIMAEFDKKNNEVAADFSDASNFIKALNAPLRSTDTAAWRKGVETWFDMDHFLKYLAINNSIVNWDTYGLMAHNYYLYNHSTRKLTWIPWDNNEALSKSPGITGTIGGGGGPGGMTGLSLRMNEVSPTWPLINFVANDGVYFNRYKTHMRDFKNTFFKQADMDNLIEKYHTMITPFVVGANGEQPKYTHLSSQNAFVAEKANLKTHISNRISLLNQFVP